jgi:predicted 2-oxoglutarate/Fe(II)-dependent dioxygenase YbiX
MNPAITPIKSGEPHYVGSQILISEHVFDDASCREFMAYADANAGNPAYVGKPQEDSSVENTYSYAFVADRIDVINDLPMANKLNGICENYYRQIAEPYYDMKVEWFEIPHLLRYPPGGKCGLHADAENWIQEEYQWVRLIDRDYSSVIYFNSDYSGGGLAFPDLNIRIRPGNGMIVTFPTDHRFIHEVEPVIEGTRYSCVMWAAAVGTDRCNKMVTDHIVRLRDPQAQTS